MPRPPRRLAPFALVATATLALSACGDDGPTPGTTVTVTSEATREALDKPEQQQVDKATARKALPTVKDMPEGPWGPSRVVKDTDPSDYEPAVCAAVELDSQEARTLREDHRKVSEEARYSAFVDDENRIIATYLDSYDIPVPASLLDAAGEHVTECAPYDEKRPSGSSSTKTATPITTEAIGDQSFGVRISINDGDSHVDRLYVRSGHNLITVMVLTHEDAYDGKLMTTYAQGILDDLKKTS